MLTATLACAMANVTNAVFQIQHYGEMAGEVKQALAIFALATNNTVKVNTFTEETSVACTKRKWSLEDNRQWEWMVNLDDDLIIHYNAFDALLNRSGGMDVHTLGVVDAYNCRGYDDFDRNRYWGLDDYLARRMPVEKAKVHFFKSRVTIPYSWLSQLYAMRRRVVEDDNLWVPIEEQFNVKGIRGYDIALEKRLVELKYKIGYTMGCESHHVGMEQKYLNDVWKGIDPVVNERVTLNGN